MFRLVTFAVIPALNEQAFIKSEVYLARAID